MAWFLFPKSFSAKDFPLAPSMYLLPILMRNLRISGWKITIRAITPTSRTMSRSALMSLILKAATNTLIMNNDMIARKILMADEPLIQRNTTKIIKASSSTSRTSASDTCKKLNIPSTIQLFITPQK